MSTGLPRSSFIFASTETDDEAAEEAIPEAAAEAVAEATVDVDRFTEVEFHSYLYGD